MLPSLRHFLRFIDAEQKVEKHGFQKKVSILAAGKNIVLIINTARGSHLIQ
jgi:hypothetical protein